MACIIYYKNLDYDHLPTSGRKRARISPTDSLASDQSTSQTSSSNSSTHQQPTWETYTNNTSIEQPCESYSPVKQPTTKKPPARKPLAKCQSSGQTYPGFQSARQPLASNPPERHPLSDYHSTKQQSVEYSYTSYSTNSYSSSNDSKLTYTPTNHASACNPPTRKPPKSRLVNNQIIDHKLLIDTLKKYFNFSSFRQNQLEAVQATCQGLDTLVLMPTGGGKSICYQLPAIVTPGVSIVVSPLKSLIDDQVGRLKSLNIKTSALMGETNEREASEIYQDLKSCDPEHKLLYVTPEKINCSGALISLFSQLHSQNLLARFVIDEAHCVSMWGSDFRPDYRKLGKLRELFPGVPIMALTATAPPKVRDDIYRQLKMNTNTGKTFIQSFNRPNLKFEVRPKAKECVIEIRNLIKNQFEGQCGIIYCLSRNDCERLAEKLREKGISSAPYHAGLSDPQRRRVFQAWSNGTFQVVCATIAFGMGIDKSDVRFVIHYSVPKSVEGYYQEAGRAGRDGKFASCILYFSKSDLYRMKSMLSKGFGRTNEDKERDRANLEHVLEYVDNGNDCRRAILLRYLGEDFNSNDCISHIRTACDNCLAHRK